MSFGMGGGESSSHNSSTSQSSSNMLTPEQLRSYFTEMDALSGGRIGTFAQGGGEYRPTSDAELRSLGGAGASREAAAVKARAEAVGEITSDPSMSVFQRQRARQITDNDYSARMDAIKKETEALQSAGASQRHDAYLKELELLSSIFYGGKGSNAQSTSSSSSGSSSWDAHMSGGWK
ncbi:MAG: hypothetical protein CVV05_15540 [Gammaproteobacteria bacterium HGW-Gammaproteobacteria-1]|jgi:hypothetical protein|nr:MAG: hypothetical protein CVV05_15540 [Gammaproteobacteria bacterium HGW-Gammaproteobacteria-1]